MRHLLIYILLPSLSLFSLLTLSSFAYQYGPVKPGETLWSIAKKVRPNTSVSITKMMQMIQKNNPHAFKNNSASSLMENTTLTIPVPAITTTKQLTRAEQRQQLLRQLAKNKQHVSTQNITKLKEELKLSQIRFKKIEDRNQELLKKMQQLHLQLQKLQAKVLKAGEQRHSLNTHTTQNNSDS
ncbi:FimV/HubP family polar landmark protein [Piscirickettsia salmonis]|uniref:FimV/HubP family polar landmark protein n=1 Tax=Piscirickettsia salmonis TaxID=1238 RepID=UPI0007C88944|nr:hypothetical protein A0O36_02475 [Piscirickettsiaceae bacterium NZ-RLO1]